MSRSTSRLMAKLDAAIRDAQHPLQAQCLRAERVGVLARQGQLERARDALDELNTLRVVAWRPPELRAWIALGQGLHAFYSCLTLTVLPLFQEAYDCAREAADTADSPERVRLKATTAAWLAHIAASGNDMTRAAALVREALELAHLDHHGARARAALTAAFHYHYTGRVELAMRWYEASRRHAIMEGDEAHLSALIYNQAAMRVDQACLGLLFDDSSDQTERSRQALMTADSIVHYLAGAGTAVLTDLARTLRACALSALGQWAEAQAAYDTHAQLAVGAGMAFDEPYLLADRAWCAFQLGDAARAQTLADAAEGAIDAESDPDNRAMALARLSQVHAALGDAERANSLRQDAHVAYAEYLARQAWVSDCLDAHLASIDPAHV